MPKQPTESPISIRLPEVVRNAVAAYAAEHEIAFNRAIRQLVESGLAQIGVDVSRGKGEAALEPPAGLANKVPVDQPKTDLPDMLAKKPARRAKSDSAYCEHRVPLTSFCSKCAGMSF